MALGSKYETNIVTAGDSKMPLDSQAFVGIAKNVILWLRCCLIQPHQYCICSRPGNVSEQDLGPRSD